MARPKREINAECGKRLKILLQETNTKQIELANLINLTQQTISQIINGKANLTPETADLIVEKFPQYNKQWLLGELPPELKTESELLLSLKNTSEALEDIARDKQRKQRQAVRGIVECSGFSVDCNDESITIRKYGTTKEITIPQSEAFGYCDELAAIIKAFVEYHFLQHRRLKIVKVLKTENEE